MNGSIKNSQVCPALEKGWPAYIDTTARPRAWLTDSRSNSGQNLQRVAGSDGHHRAEDGEQEDSPIPRHRRGVICPVHTQPLLFVESRSGSQSLATRSIRATISPRWASFQDMSPDPRDSAAETSSQKADDTGKAQSEPKELSAAEQMALYEKELKENDWGHQPC
jgi:hypothetical protein